jgi:hypothetical protein
MQGKSRAFFGWHSLLSKITMTILLQDLTHNRKVHIWSMSHCPSWVTPPLFGFPNIWNCSIHSYHWVRILHRRKIYNSECKNLTHYNFIRNKASQFVEGHISKHASASGGPCIHVICLVIQKSVDKGLPENRVPPIPMQIAMNWWYITFQTFTMLNSYCLMIQIPKIQNAIFWRSPSRSNSARHLFELRWDPSAVTNPGDLADGGQCC